VNRRLVLRVNLRLFVAAAALAATVAGCSTTRRAASPVPPPPAAPPSESPPPPAAPVDAALLAGDWSHLTASDGVQGLRLEEDGHLTIIGTAPTRGVDWKASGGSLLLSMENPGVGPWKLSVPVEEANGSRLKLGGSNAAFAGPWRRATFTTLEGTVTYRQRGALTPEAVVFVDLRDAGAPAEEPPLARARVLTPGQAPLRFHLIYDPASLDPARSYALSARIADRGELRFVTEKAVPLPTAGDAPPVEIVVVPVR